MRTLLFVLAACCIQVAAATEDKIPSSALVRNAIVVNDVDVSKHFYVNALGFTPGFDGDISGEWVSRLLQLDESATVRFAVLTGAMEVAGREVDGAMIGLLEIGGDGAGEVQRVGGNTLARGEVVLAIVTDDIQSVFLRLKDLNADILVEPANSPNGAEVELVIRDPDGVRIHVVQRLLDLPDSGDE